MASIYLKNGYWWIAYTHDGKRVQRTTKIPKNQKPLARQYKKQLEADLLNGHLGLVSKIGIMEAFRRYLETVKATKSDRTLERYTECLNSFTKFWAKKYPKLKLLHDITLGRVQNWVTHRSSVKAPKTVQIELTVLISALNFAVRQGWIPKSPISANLIDKPRPLKRKPTRFFSPAELKVIFEKSTPRRSDLWKFLYYTATRIGEASRLKVSAIGKDFITLPALTTKSRRLDTIPIANNLRPVLERLCSGKKPDDPLFPEAPEWGRRFNNLRVEFQSFLKKNDIKKADLHTFRHTAASHWVQKGVPIRVVMDMMRHKDIKYTMVYSHLAPEDSSKFVNQLFL